MYKYQTTTTDRLNKQDMENTVKEIITRKLQIILEKTYLRVHIECHTDEKFRKCQNRKKRQIYC